MNQLETATNEQLAESLLAAMTEMHNLTKWLPFIAEAARRLKPNLPEPSRSSHYS